MKRRLLIYLVIAILVASNAVLGVIAYNQNQWIEKCNKPADVHFTAIVLPDNNYINLGDEYLAGIYLTSTTEDNLPTVIINDTINGLAFRLSELKDTLVYDFNYHTFVYKHKPKTKGERTLSGAIFFENKGKIDSLFFRSNYCVK